MRIKGKLVTEPYPPGPKTGQRWGEIRIFIRKLAKSRPVTWHDLVPEDYTTVQHKRAVSNLHRMMKAGQLLRLSMGKRIGPSPESIPPRYVSTEMDTETLKLFV